MIQTTDEAVITKVWQNTSMTLNIILLGNGCISKPRLCICYSGWEAIRNRKGSEIWTTDRTPLSHRFISIAGGMEMTQALPDHFLNFLTSNSKFLNSLQNSERFFRGAPQTFKDLGFLVLFSQLLATTTEQLQEPNISRPKRSYFQEAALLNQQPRFTM